MYAVIRIRGTVNLSPRIKKALIVLGLKRINNLCILKEDAQSEGMIKKVKDYVTYGKISDETLKDLIQQKAKTIKPGQKIDPKKILEEIKKGSSPKRAGIKNLFTMSPPRGGFERKGIKVPFSLGGALGNRKEKINELIIKMM